MAAMAVVVDSGSSGIEPTAPMAASSMMVANDGNSNNGAFTTASHDNDRPLRLLLFGRDNSSDNFCRGTVL